MTGLGITGTFIGILIGIPKGTSFDEISQGLPQFISGMKGAFVTSVVGIVLALVFTFIEKLATDQIEGLAVKLSDAVDALFQRRTEQDYLFEIAMRAEEQLAEMKGLALNVGREVIKGITGAGLESIQIDQSIKDGVAKGFSSLAETLLEFQTFQTTFLTSIREVHASQAKVAENFHQLNQVAEASYAGMKQISQSLVESAQGVEAASQHWKDAIGATKTTVETQQNISSLLNGAVEKTKNTVDSLIAAQPAITEKLGGAVKDFGALQNTFTENVAGYHDKINTSLEKNLVGFDKHLADAVGQLGNGVQSLNGVVIEMSTRLTEVQKSLEEIQDFGKIRNAAE